MADGVEERDRMEPSHGGDEAPLVSQVVETGSRFSKEFIATMISLATAAFGVVAALAWNEAITGAFTEIFGRNSKGRLSALFVYATLVTMIGVLVIVMLGRLATRINAQPVEFKYPAAPKPESH